MGTVVSRRDVSFVCRDSPLPGQTSSCVPLIPACTNEYVPLRIAVGLLSVAIAIALLVLAWPRNRAQQGTLRPDASGVS